MHESDDFFQPLKTSKIVKLSFSLQERLLFPVLEKLLLNDYFIKYSADKFQKMFQIFG